jgi:uncharacterized protein (TIGR00369 family)
MSDRHPPTKAYLTAIGASGLAGFMGMEVVDFEDGRLTLHLPVSPRLLNPMGVVHGGAIISLADTACGYATLVSLPDDATAFTTIELKSNFLGAVKDGTLTCVATPVHRGRTTMVWDADVTHLESGRRIALFRCTNLVLR